MSVGPSAAAADIHRVTRFDLRVEPWAWPFAQARRAEIDAHFAERQREKPKLWNGRVLLGRDAVFADGVLSARYFEVDFASFLTWRDWDFPDHDVFNGFGLGALRCSDGAFALGIMAAHTANAGRIYFPSGTPDLDDVRDGMLDIPGSVAREVLEETGLAPGDYRAADRWDCVVTGRSLAMFRVLDVNMTGEALKARIEAGLAREHQPELSGIHLVRSLADITATVPHFVVKFLEAQFGK